jgi:hypothetical protein
VEILVNTALWWVQFAIDLNNAMAASIGDATPPNWNSLNVVHQALTDIALGLLYAIAGLLLVIQMLMRWRGSTFCWLLRRSRQRAGFYRKRRAGLRPGIDSSQARFSPSSSRS